MHRTRSLRLRMVNLKGGYTLTNAFRSKLRQSLAMPEISLAHHPEVWIYSQTAIYVQAYR